MLAIFVFFNKTRHKVMNCFTFSKHFKHVDVYTNDGRGWLGLRFSSDGITYSIVGDITGRQLIERSINTPTVEAVVAIEVESRCRFPWRPLAIPMCNEVARLAAGVDIGHTWNPGHLYRKLLKYDHKRNYGVIYRWRLSNGS